MYAIKTFLTKFNNLSRVSCKGPSLRIITMDFNCDL